jgi:transcriptional regulator with XRE-family HTH domain
MKEHEKAKEDAAQLKRLRLQLGLTQKALGKRLKLAQTAISHWEMALTYPMMKTEIKLVKMAEKKGFKFNPRYLRED